MRIKLLTALCLASLAVPAGAQFAHSGYSFLQAVRERDGNKATELLQVPGSTVVNFRNDRGEGALHIVTARRDLSWMRFLIGQRANVDLANRRNGDTALIVAARMGFLEGVEELLRARASVDQTNGLGETPLIIAVQQRQMAVVRRLVAAGANPDHKDNASGRSAREYAGLDARGAEMLRIMDGARAARPRPVAGPTL